MMTNLDKFLKSLLVGVLAVAFNFAATDQAFGQASVTTDKPDYSPGSTVQISGSGFAVCEAVQLQVLNVTYPDDIGLGYLEHEPWQITADASGNIAAEWNVSTHELNTTLQLMATGLTSGLTAQMTFTDAGKTWVGGASGAPNDWGTAANWSPSGVPVSNDDVTIPATNSFPILTNGQSFTVRSLTVQSGATLTINSGASLDASGGSPVITGTINTAGTLNFGTRNINNAVNTGTINVSGGTVTAADVNATALNFNISGGSVNVNNYSANTVMSGGLLQPAGNFAPNSFGATGGTVRLDSAGTVPALAYYNLEISSGSPKLAGDLTVAGNLAIDTGAKLNLNGKSASANSLTLGGVIQTAGNFNQNNVSTYISGTTTSVTVSAGALTKLAFTTQPMNTTAGLTMTNIVVQIQDDSGNPVVQSGTAITLTLNGSTLYSGTNTQTTDFTGKATFSDLVIRQAGAGLNFSAAASGLTGTTSSNFNITAAAPSRLAFTTQPAGTTSSATMTAVVVQLQDQFSNNVAGSGTNISLTLNGGGILGGTTNLTTDASGKATFTNLTITGAGGGKSFTASASPLTSATSSAFNVNKASSAIVVGSSLNPSGYKGAVTFTATLSSGATGSVIFATTNAPFSTNALSSGRATSLSLTNLIRGTNVITVQYAGDANYLGSTNSLVQIVTNHPPVAASFTVVNDVNAFKMTISALLTNVTDVDGDTIALTGFTTSTNGVVIFTNTTLFQYCNTNHVSDQFSYIVNDGFGGSSTGVVSVVFNAFGPGNPQAGQGVQNGQAGIVISSDGVAHVTYYGIPNYQYGIQRTTDLSTWVTIQTTNAPSNGVFDFDDDFSDLGKKPSSAFYRLRWNP